MSKFFIYLCGILFCLACTALPCISNESVGSDYEQTCTITKIEGAVVTTSCKIFEVSENMTVQDITGRRIRIYELPLPCSAKIEYSCISKKNCASITSITVLQAIKVLPE